MYQLVTMLETGMIQSSHSLPRLEIISALFPFVVWPPWLLFVRL